MSVHLSLLFPTMLRHGLTPDGMLKGTMIPIPKRKLAKDEAHLCTSNLQFGIKQGSSTSLFISMVQETISYYVHNGPNVYGLMLDASKAFDCKLLQPIPNFTGKEIMSIVL